MEPGGQDQLPGGVQGPREVIPEHQTDVAPQEPRGLGELLLQVSSEHHILAQNYDF